jgi:hypothetical protein
MNLIPLTNAESIQRSFKTAVTTLQKNSHEINRKVGWRGGGGKFSIYWRPDEGFWFLVDEVREESRYWLCFGVQDPTQINSLTIVAEINPTKSGINRRNAGFFVQDRQKRIFLAHSGKVGGGRKGIGRSSFLVITSDGMSRALNGLTALNRQRLSLDESTQIDCRYTFPISSLKLTDIKGRVAEVVPSKVGERLEAEPELVSYTPEFAGHRNAYVIAHEIEAKMRSWNCG